MAPRLLLLSFFLLTNYTLRAQREDVGQRNGSDTVFVQGLVQKPLALTLANLEGLPVKTEAGHNLTNASGEIRRKMGPFKAILLRDILRKAEVDMAHKERGKYFVVVTAVDGYQTIFAYNELIHGPAAAGAYLLIEEDGKPVQDGPFTLLCTTDIASVPRYTKRVRSIEVRKI